MNTNNQEAFVPPEVLENYIEQLTNHDWFYSYSDDNRVWRSGVEREKYLVDLSKTHPMFAEAYKAWLTYINTLVQSMDRQVRHDAQLKRDRTLYELKLKNHAAANDPINIIKEISKAA